MRTRALFSVILAAVVVLGCATDRMRPATHAVCQTPTCRVAISVINGQVEVDIDTLEIKGNKNVRILWRLPPGYEFNASMGDGVFFKRDDGGQFEDPYVTDDDGGQPSANRRAGKIFHWRDKNTVLKSYEYMIKFHDRAGNPYVKDPTIMNAG